MKVAVVCANGRGGRLVVKEAVDRGVDVTAIAKGENQTVAKQYIRKDLFDLTAEDVAVDAFGAWAEEVLPLHSKSLMHLCDIVSGTKKRLVVVGGAGSLYENKEHTAVVSDGPDFPAEYLPLAKAQGKVKSIGQEKLDEIFEKNSYMVSIYPTPKSRSALEVFCIYEAEGEYFDLGQNPVYRQNFAYGGAAIHETGYQIDKSKCIGCQGCRSVCPVQCISKEVPREKDRSRCLHCGNCFRICPVKAVVRLEETV